MFSTASPDIPIWNSSEFDWKFDTTFEPQVVLQSQSSSAILEKTSVAYAGRTNLLSPVTSLAYSPRETFQPCTRNDGPSYNLQPYGDADEFELPPSKRRCSERPRNEDCCNTEQAIVGNEPVSRQDYKSYAAQSLDILDECPTLPELHREDFQENVVYHEAEDGQCERTKGEDFGSYEMTGQSMQISAESNSENTKGGFESPDDEVCFGMILLPLSTSPGLGLLQGPTQVRIFESLQLSDEREVVSGPTRLSLGHLSDQKHQIIQVLKKEPGITLNLRGIVQFKDAPTTRRKQQVSVPTVSVNLSVIIYGPFSLFEFLGTFLEDCDICLQDPQGCDRNVRYRNPHALDGLADTAPMTCDRPLHTEQAHRDDHPRGFNLLDDLDFHEDLPFASVPSAISTKPFKHQLQALYFMKRRERGWCFDGAMKEIWRLVSISGIPVYLNTITDNEQTEAPPTFRGGLLADDMGLGKTLSMISLVASDLDLACSPSNVGAVEHLDASSRRDQCTLIVVPPTLLNTWESQLRRHLKPGRLRWVRHHSQQRLTEVSQLALYDVIVTSYHTVASEWRRRHKIPSILFAARWHRVILDEAHVIRDQRTQVAESICALQADRRWAVTGTPIQNHISDFVALLRFLRASPYDNSTAFEHDILDLWDFDEKAAISRLQRLITSIGLRRACHTISLPSRTDRVAKLQFRPEEKEFYDSIETKAMVALNHINLKGEAQKVIGLNALQYINMLRLICNFGTVSKIEELAMRRLAEQQWNSSSEERGFQDLVSADGPFLGSSTLSLEPQSSPFDSVGTPPMAIQSCGALCNDCANQLCPGEDWTNIPPCKSCSPSIMPSSDHSTLSDLAAKLDVDKFPTKVEALVNDVRAFPESKSVVFSAWRKTLDIAACAFHKAGISCVRFDGKTSRKERAAALSEFTRDSSIKVILFTISCGAVGLDLTAADRVYLMEPQWNPTVEAQALARVHRMGQKRPITTVRYIIEGSYEQHIIRVQNRKKDLADVLLSSKKTVSSTVNGRSRLEQLRSLLR